MSELCHCAELDTPRVLQQLGRPNQQRASSSDAQASQQHGAGLLGGCVRQESSALVAAMIAAQ